MTLAPYAAAALALAICLRANGLGVVLLILCALPAALNP